MTFKEAIAKTEQSEEALRKRERAKRRLMRKVYHRVCKNIRCKYCPVGETCSFRDGLYRVDFSHALKCITDADVIKVSEWSREQS